MSWLFPREPPDSITLGRTHEVPAEIHYSSGSDKWWSHGPLWLSETRPIHEGEFSPVLRDPRNRPILRKIKRGETDEGIARWMVNGVQHWLQQDGPEPARLSSVEEQEALTSAKSVVKEVRRASDRANEPHILRIYGLREAYKQDERVLVTIDQDLIHEAPMIPFTRTEKGNRRLQWAMMAAMGIIDAIFLFAMVTFLSAGPQLVAGTAQAQQAAQSLFLTFGELIALPTAILVTYVLMARRTLVLDMEIQPVVEGLQDTHSEAVYLVNSEKTPASTYHARTFHIDPSVVRGLTEEISRFQSDTIANLQEQARSLRTELDSAKVLGVEAWSQSADLRALGHDRAPSIHRDPVGMWVLVGVVGIVVGVAVWAAMAAGA
ncbi:MAG: hypothetical protein ACYDDZ_06615 [Acidimicrobiales bacterium]